MTADEWSMWYADSVSYARGLAMALAHPLTEESRPGSIKEVAQRIVDLLANPSASNQERARNDG